MTLRDRVVVVTGGARGVGRYVAGSFAREGCRLAIPEIDAERMASTAGELRGLGAEVLTAAVDVTDEPAVSAFRRRLPVHQTCAPIHAAGWRWARAEHLGWI
ncbi:MAG: SDR family NAD(P)-dependent oxidoreductase [Chloroflexi bacterium]|nr:SDR family NAD(P)-dependent oxidoreductase [Chloroflexota bacterium]MBV9600419.1 SDR family NAD(P)-dependent oxidoreductase [Chloroflexota bacterium]